MTRNRLAAALIAAMFAAPWALHAAPADDLKEAQRLYGQGKVEPAMDKVNGFLKAQPRDAQGRFLKGLLLTEQKKTAEAIQVFTGLTEDYPELPEPYNNLAVLYAQQGNYDKAKSALELAIHTHPSYATAHENLGDIYAQLASRAYDRALQLDKNNATAQTKLALVKDLFVAQRGTATKAPAPATKAEPLKPDAKVVAKAEPPKAEPPKGVAKAEPPKAEPPKPEPAKVAAAPAKPEPAKVAAAPAKPEPAKVETKSPSKAEPAKAPSPQPSPKAEGEKAAPAAAAPAAAAPAAAAGNDERAITAAIESWAKAWSAKDVKGYLGAYAPDFEVPGGEKRAAWEKQRAERIERPKSIEVGVKINSVKVAGNEATVNLRQSYKSDTLKTNSTKVMKLVKSGDRWLIKQERAGG